MITSNFYFGPRGYMQNIVPPAVSADATKTGFNVTGSFLSGGAYNKQSQTSAKHYSFSWDKKTRAQMRTITDYADGIYGPGPFYWLDPFNMDVNLLPAWWAAPMFGATDGPILNGQLTARPTLTPTGTNNFMYPSQSAVYTVNSSAVGPTVWVPVAPGFTLWAGAVGSNSGAYVTVTPTTGSAGLGTPANLTMLTTASGTQVNYSVDGNTYNGAQLQLTGSGTLILTSVCVQVLPNGMTPVPGNFYSGQGHSGCTFDGQPTLTQYSATLDQVGLSAKLVETQGWIS